MRPQRVAERGTSSPTKTLAVAAISKSGGAAARLGPKASSKRSGATKIGSQPSAISAASATFFGPSAAR